MREILICDDDPLFHMSIKQALGKNFKCRSAYSGDEALAILKNHTMDILLLDVHMKFRKEGLSLIPKILELSPDTAIVMSSSTTDFQIVREAMRLGAADYLSKDFNTDEILHSLKRIFERRDLLRRQSQNAFETESSQKKYVIVGNSPAVQGLRKVIEKARESTANVIITGETGTGKELIARQLRRKFNNGTFAPFLAVDSSTIQSSTAESILFGHEKGAFTGADKTTKGIFEEAHHGSVYFDEISNMPLEIQAKLLRVLQEKEISRLGSSRTIQLEFRVICASNNDLEKMCQTGKFKYDLFQRLNVIPIHIPPLRERIEDLHLLIDYFISNQSANKQALRFSPEALQAMQSYSWPGNVRELQNLVAYLTTMAESPEIGIADLPQRIRGNAERMPSKDQIKDRIAENNSMQPSVLTNFYEQVSEFERNILKAEYDLQKGKIGRLAAKLGMDRSHLYSKLKAYEIHPVKAARE